jgi:hypothetical protein
MSSLQSDSVEDASDARSTNTRVLVTTQHTRLPQGDEPSHKGRNRMYYCKYCPNYGAQNTSNFRQHLSRQHNLDVAASPHPVDTKASVVGQSSPLDAPASVDDLSASLPLPLVNDTRRRSPRSDGEKLDMACSYMRKELGWSISDFIKALASAGGNNNARRKSNFAAAAYKDPEVVKGFFDDTDQPWDGVRASVIDALDLGNNELRKEVGMLGSMAPFNKYSPGGDFDTLDMDQTLNAIQGKAPLLLQLIRDIIAPEARRTYQRQKEPAARIVAIISILCFSQRQNTCTGFQTTLGLYLHSKGVKRRQLELLGRLGLVVSYPTVLQVIKEQSVRAAADVEGMGQRDDSVTAYDNFEIMLGVKEQGMENQATFHSVTTGQVIQGIEIPPGELRQDMLDPQAEINATDVLLAPGNLDDDMQRQVRIC